MNKARIDYYLTEIQCWEVSLPQWRGTDDNQGANG